MNTVPYEPVNQTVLSDTQGVPAQAIPSMPGYEVQVLVGRGGMGKVYRARHLELNRTVAIKVLAHEPDDRALTRFRDEARAVARLQHPNIAQLYDTGMAEGRQYLVQEFIAGGTLAERFDGMPQDPAYVAEVVEAIAQGVQHSHDNGILHRDLKPGNVLLTTDGIPKVTDFGLAKTLTATDSTISHYNGLTQTGEILGTPSYMPPEQATGVTTTLTPAADVYSLGAILYEGLTGRPPFQSSEPLQTLLMVLTMEPVAPRTLLPKLPKDLETICLKCLEKSPKKRYAKASELADDLRRWRSGEPILARPVGFFERLGKWARRRKAAAALVAVSGLLLIALIGFGILQAIHSARLRKANEALGLKNEELARLNNDLEHSKGETDLAFLLATDTLDRMVTQTTLKLDGIPKADGLLLDTLAQASELNKQLVALRPNDRGSVGRYARGLLHQLTTETNHQRRSAAEKSRTALREFLTQELAKNPSDTELRSIEVQLVYDAYLTARGEGKPMEAPLKEVVESIDRFARDFADNPSVRTLLIKKWWAVAGGLGQAKDSAGQAEVLAKAVAEARKFPKDDANRMARQTFLITSLMQLGEVRKSRGELSEANDAFAEVARESEPFAATNPVAKSQLADAWMKQANILFEQGQSSDALKLFGKAEPLLRQLAADFPLQPGYKFSLSECLFDYGYGRYLSGDRKTGLAMIEESIKVMDALIKLAPNQPIFKEIRGNYVERRDSLAEKK